MSVSDTLILTMLETRQMPVYNGICVYIVLCTGQLALYSAVYCRIIYCGGQVCGYDEGYEGSNLASRIA